MVQRKVIIIISANNRGLYVCACERRMGNFGLISTQITSLVDLRPDRKTTVRMMRQGELVLLILLVIFPTGIMELCGGNYRESSVVSGVVAGSTASLHH